MRSFSGNLSTASRRAMRSTSPSSGASVPSSPSSARPSAVYRCKESGASVARSTWAISSGVHPV